MIPVLVSDSAIESSIKVPAIIDSYDPNLSAAMSILTSLLSKYISNKSIQKYIVGIKLLLKTAGRMVGQNSYPLLQNVDPEASSGNKMVHFGSRSLQNCLQWIYSPGSILARRPHSQHDDLAA